MMRWPLVLLAACSDPICDADLLREALDRQDDEVEIGACRIEADVTVPGGTTLRGQADATIAGMIHVVASPDAARIEKLRVESDGPAGIVVRGAGTAVIEDVVVDASLGVGIGVDGVAGVRIARTSVRGVADESDAVTFGVNAPVPSTISTHGLIVKDTASATLEDVSVRGFASFGVLMLSSTTAWNGGDASDNISVGVMVARGRASISNVVVGGTIESAMLDSLTYGVVTGTAAVETVALSVHDTGGVGVFHLHGHASHSLIDATGNQYGAVRFERVSSGRVAGQLANNRFGGVLAFDSNDITVEDAQIMGTFEVISNQTMAGDGIHLVGGSGARIANTVLAENDRVGVAIDLMGATLSAGIFDNVTVSRGGTADYGVLVQGGTLGSGWETGLSRDADTIAADQAFTGTFDTVGAVGPCFFPRPDAPIP
jgi:hypothetical protein